MREDPDDGRVGAGGIIAARKGIVRRRRAAMASIAKLSPTSTLTAGGGVVPWLAAHGRLAYSVDEPPDRDRSFQYGWVMPGILNPQGHLRRHYYFGAAYREHARELFAFWTAARARDVERVAVREGRVEACRVRAPVAIYRWQSRQAKAAVFVQHGSFQWVTLEDQPRLTAGLVRLYRGIQKAKVFRLPTLPPDGARAWRHYFEVQAAVLADSVASFNSVHDRIKRAETSHLLDGSWMTDHLARKFGLPIDGAAKSLWRAAHASYSLARWVADRKFGPNYVVCETPVDNIRLTTFFAGENEVRIVDPRLVQIVECIGCRVVGPAPYGDPVAPPAAALHAATVNGHG